MEKLLTIVVAAYNKEKELPKCLDSIIIEPKLMDLVEVFVINDGSRDNTLTIAKEYEEKYPGYIFAIDQTNGNYGKVMNHGLSLAKGKYFKTLDADDWYDTEAYSLFVKMLKDTDADMIVNQRTEFLAETGKYQQLIPLFDNDVVLNKDLNASEVNWENGSIRWNLNVPHITYKTSLLKESGLKWIERISYTDTMFDFWPLRLVKTVRFVPLKVYVYMIGTDEQSMSPANIAKNFNHFYQVANAILDNFKANYDKSVPMYPIQLKFVKQILGYVFMPLLYSDDRIEDIKALFLKMDFMPELQTYFKNNIKDHGVKYLSLIENAKVPFAELVLRAIRRFR